MARVKRSKGLNIILIVIFLIVTIFGLGIFFYSLSLFKSAWASRSWPTTSGIVVSSSVDSYWSESETGSSKSTTLMYSAKIIYKYTADETDYTSQKISFGDYDSNNSREIQAVVDRYPLNSDVLVYYNPENPEMSVLEPGKLGGVAILFIAGAVISIVGILLLKSQFI
jgi:hypothetical protein